MRFAEQNEVAWMSLYFSVAVWFSIAPIDAPVFKRHRVPRKAKKKNPLKQR
jgi:hypothetical protein